MSRVAVIIPVKIGSDFVFEALDSVMQQDFSDYSIQLVFDGPDFETEYRLADYGTDTRIHWTTLSSPQGISVALNAGIALTDSEFIVRLDADDLMRPNRIGKQLERMRFDSSIGVLGTGIERFGNQKGIQRFPLRHSRIILEMGFRNCIAHPTVMLRREALEALPGEIYRSEFDGAEDYDLWERLSRDWRLENLPEALTAYRIHSEQTSALQDLRQEAREADIRERFRSRVGWRPNSPKRPTIVMTLRFFVGSVRKNTFSISDLFLFGIVRAYRTFIGLFRKTFELLVQHRNSGVTSV